MPAAPRKRARPIKAAPPKAEPAPVVVVEPPKPKVTIVERLTKISRDTVLFVSGLLGFYHELIIEKGERPQILLACVGLMGLPAFIRNDEKKG